MRKRLKALGLFEIIIALGVISTTIIISMSAIISTTEGMRRNDIEETANFILVKAIEIARSPSPITLDGDPDLFNNFTVSKDINGAFVLKGIQIFNEEEPCSESSQFYVSDDLNVDSLTPMCLRISVNSTMDSVSNKSVFTFNSTVYYTYKSENIQNDAFLIRYDEVNII